MFIGSNFFEKLPSQLDKTTSQDKEHLKEEKKKMKNKVLRFNRKIRKKKEKWTTLCKVELIPTTKYIKNK